MKNQETIQAKSNILNILDQLQASDLNNKAEDLYNKQKYQESLELHLKALNMREIYAPNSLNESISYHGIGNAYYGLEEYNKAINYFEKAIKIEEKQAPNSLTLANYYNDIAITYNFLKEYK